MSASQNSSLSPLAALADPPIRYVDTAAMDYFLIEMVSAIRESAAVATARQKKIEQEMIEAGLIPPTPIPPVVKKENARDSTASIVSRPASTSGKSTADDEEEQVRQRLESIGMHVGANFSERSVFLSLLIPSLFSFKNNLDCAKTDQCSLTLWTSSSSSAKISGLPAGISRSTICGRIIGWVFCPTILLRIVMNMNTGCICLAR